MDTSKQMPNLMGAAHGAADGNRRILAQLEHGAKACSRATRPARTWNVDGWTVGLVLLLLTLGGIAWLMHEETITPVTFKRQPAAAYADSQVVHAEHPAAIVNQPHLAASAPSGTFAVPLASTSAEQRGMAVASGPPRKPGTPTRINDAGKTADQAAPHKSTIASHGKPAPVAPRVRPGSSPIPPAASDTDVTLLTALVAHAGKPASTTPERSRDVVERADGMPTADLLARCKQLGLMEGMLCRSRICSGSWESDPACLAPPN